jgi:hypothetical protein
METSEKIAGWAVVTLFLLGALILLPALALAAPCFWAALTIMDRVD